MKTEARETVPWKAPKAITPFNYGGVQLGKSMFQEQFNRMKQYYLAIPNDDLLKGFRERAKVSAPGKDLEGWYSRFPSTFGQWLGAFARMYKATNDAAILRKIEYLLGEWGKTIASDGYSLYGRPHHYTFEKTVGGLVDIYEYLGKEESILYLKRITDWAITNLSQRRVPATPDSFMGGGGSEHDTEWYTFPENYYRAYLLTGDSGYQDFAKLWHYETYWGDLAEKKQCMTGLHAYSHVNTLSSAAMAYAVSGDTSYLNTILNAYELLQTTQIFATGGYGPGETMANQYGSLGNSLYLQENSFENPCGSWAGFKLVRYLMMFTGKAHYGDWIEKLLYNGIGATLPMKENGKTHYYCDYRVNGGEKKYYKDTWPCCSGTYPLAVTDYHNIIYFKDKDSLYVNIFIPSQVEWNKQGHTINLIQDTDFPKTGKVSLKIGTPEPVQFCLKFRIPGWIKDSVSVRVNNRPLSGNWKPGQWGRIRRTWTEEDKVEITFPLHLYFVPVDRYHPHLAALMYGPVAVVADKAGPLHGDRENPSSWIIPVSGEPLVFQATRETDKRVFRPYFTYKEGEHYYMYQKVEK